MAQKLWGNKELHALAERYTVGNDYILDLRLLRYDCLGSIAHVRMLAQVGLIRKKDAEALVKELEKIKERAERGEFPIRPDQEDGHTAIEQHLVATLGEVGKKVHTGRSRNDQVLTALRLFYKDELAALRREIEGLGNAVRTFNRRHGRVQMPGFTHTRKAMPSSMRLWAGALADALKDDLKVLETALRLMDQSPLGSGAGFGVPLKLDRNMTARELGFAKVQQNPVYVQLSRGKFESTMLHGLSQVMWDLNRVAADLILFSMPEFGFFELPAELCTGSSIMPQKQNPDVLELVRANYHVVLGCEGQLRTQTAGLIHGYHRDLQLTKEPAMRALVITRETVAVMALVFDRLGVNRHKCKAAMTPELYATKRAYDLVHQGVPFRDAYLKVKDELERS